MSRMHLVFSLLFVTTCVTAQYTCQDPFPPASNSTATQRLYVLEPNGNSKKILVQNTNGYSYHPYGYVTPVGDNQFQLRTPQGSIIATAWVEIMGTQKNIVIVDCQGNSLAGETWSPDSITIPDEQIQITADYSMFDVTGQNVHEYITSPNSNNTMIATHAATRTEVARMKILCDIPSTGGCSSYWRINFEQYRAPSSYVNDPRVSALLMAIQGFPQKPLSQSLTIALSVGVATAGVFIGILTFLGILWYKDWRFRQRLSSGAAIPI